MSAQAFVYIVEDENELSEALLWLLESVKLPAQRYAGGQAFLDHCPADAAGCLLLDIRMPGLGGLELYEKHIAPRYLLPTLMMTAYADVAMAVRAMKAGAFDFFEKPINENLLLERIHQALEEDRRGRREVMARRHAQEGVQQLTKREQQMLQLLADGGTSRDIGECLHVSERTVDAHRRILLKKTGAKNLVDLVRIGYLCGLVSPLGEEDE